MFGIRELARLAQVSPNRASQVVNRLEQHGLVTVDSSPGSRRVRLNREHLAAEPSIAIAFLRSRVIDSLRGEASGWNAHTVHVSLFGSVARGDGGTDSDIDILAVHKPFSSPEEQEAWDDQLARSGETIHRWTGNWVGWFQLSEGDLGRLASEKEPIVAEWLRDAITLSGPPLAMLLRTLR